MNSFTPRRSLMCARSFHLPELNIHQRRQSEGQCPNQMKFGPLLLLSLSALPTCLPVWLVYLPCCCCGLRLVGAGSWGGAIECNFAASAEGNLSAMMLGLEVPSFPFSHKLLNILPGRYNDCLAL